MRLLVPTLGLLLLLPARAATVEVSVRERKGGLIEGQGVILQLLPAPGEVPSWDRRARTDVTGATGKVTFLSVPVGRYTILLDRVGGVGLINPSANPLAPPPQITVAAESDKVAVEIEVWRGSVLSSEIIADRSVPKGAKVVLRSLDGQPTVELPCDLLGRADTLLIPGRYEMELVIPPGYLLVDIVWNGESLPGHTIRFDVREDTRRQIVSWYISSPSLITGEVSDVTGRCPVRVVATLVEPGPWIQAATQRGGSVFQVVPHQEWVENRNCIYRLWLPDGRWTVQPQGAFESSEPESADVTIAPGETRSLNFTLTLKDGGDAEKRRKPLLVVAISPRDRALEGATIEIWPPAGRSGATEPLQTAKTGRQGSVFIRGLAAGSYLVAAGHEDYIEGTAKVEGYDPDPDAKPKSVSVILKEGAKLHAHAVDGEDRAVQGVELSYERLSPLPEMAIASEAIATRKRQGVALTDVTGHAEVGGLYGGGYRLEARMTGDLSATRFVMFRKGGANDRSIELSLSEGERSDVELLVLPAASVSGGLVCSDRGTMPPKASFRLFPSDAAVEGLWSDDRLQAGAVHTSNDVVLHGTGADRFHLGPIPPGDYHLAARPDGQHYWSWALQEVVPDRAAVYSATGAAVVDAGLIEIECGPLVAIVPEIKSKESMPDLRLGIVRASLRFADEAKKKRRDPNVETYADRAFLRRLEEGKFKTIVTVEHPYLIPPSITAPEQLLDLTRGSFTALGVVFERLGGLVEVRSDAKYVRLTPGEGDPSIRAAIDGKVDFPGTAPGSYRVDACADSECAHVTATWNVAVSAGRTTFLP